MRHSDKAEFQKLLTDVMAFYRQDVTTFALSVWWQACESFGLEQVRKAMTGHAMDPERGHFAPKPADIVRQLQGTHGDRALMAWSKAYEAAQRVGAYTTVCFDDGVIHAVIEDLGGWVKLCRSGTDEIQFVQKRFCDSYKAYASRSDVRYPCVLLGEHDLNNASKGYASQAPTLIGDPHQARLVHESGMESSRTQITHSSQVVDALRIGVAS